MTAARLSRAEARALGLDATTVSSRGRGRRTAPGKQVACCHTCHVELVGETAAARHNTDTGHTRFDIPIEPVS